MNMEWPASAGIRTSEKWGHSSFPDSPPAATAAATTTARRAAAPAARARARRLRRRRDGLAQRRAEIAREGAHVADVEAGPRIPRWRVVGRLHVEHVRETFGPALLDVERERRRQIR